MDLRKIIENYVPFNEQEGRDKEQFLKFIDTYDDVLTRENIFGHFSASAFVVNKERTKMVVVYQMMVGFIQVGMLMEKKISYLLQCVRLKKKLD